MVKFDKEVGSSDGLFRLCTYDPMAIVVGVRFKTATKIYYFAPNGVEDLKLGDHVIVETSRGREIGKVALSPREVEDEAVIGQLKNVVGRAEAWDLLQMESFRGKEPEVLAKCREKVAEYGLPMKLVSAEYSYDGTRLVFSFTSDKRVDFRELVRDLAKTFRTRIELRQIGVRDEAKCLGGLGCCGRIQCCSSWLDEFRPVSIKMAKQQNLPLSPMEISGICGRLLCCLSYENDFYCEARKNLPKRGEPVTTEHGPGKVTDVNVIKDSVTVLLESEMTVEVPASELKMQVQVQPVIEEEKPSKPPKSGKPRRNRGKRREHSNEEAPPEAN
jgi:cell fate regulator YaaT (PSP1 superfamily)